MNNHHTNGRTTKQIGRMVSQRVAEINALVATAQDLKAKEKAAQVVAQVATQGTDISDRISYWRSKCKQLTQEIAQLKAQLDAARKAKLQNFSNEHIERELLRRAKKMAQQQEAETRKAGKQQWVQNR